MREYQYSYKTEYRYSQPVSRYSFLLRCVPWEGGCQSNVFSSIAIHAYQNNHAHQVRYSIGKDAWGAEIIYGYHADYHNVFCQESSGIVAMRTQYYEMPYTGNECIFLSPTRLTYPTLKMRITAQDYSSQVLGTPLDKALSICDFVHHYMEFATGSTTIKTTAAESYEQRKGVCQDLAHILLAMCRTVDVPARYVCGLTIGEGQTHAWVEVLSKGIWFGVDPTANKLIDYGYIKIAHGRDASDCPVNCGRFYGLTSQNISVSAVLQEK